MRKFKLTTKIFAAACLAGAALTGTAMADSINAATLKALQHEWMTNPAFNQTDGLTGYGAQATVAETKTSPKLHRSLVIMLNQKAETEVDNSQFWFKDSAYNQTDGLSDYGGNYRSAQITR